MPPPWALSQGSFAELVARPGGARNIADPSTLALVEAGPSRPDLPVRREAASLAAAVEAVRPANVKRAVTELRDNMLARSTRGPYESRLRTWNRLAFEGKVPTWPITTRTLEVIGAAFQAGAYRSAKEYFLAVFRYQEHDLRIEVDPLLRRFANRDRAAFDPNRAAHSHRRFRRGRLVHAPRDRGGGRQGRRHDPPVLEVRLRRNSAPVVPGARGYETHDPTGGGRPPRLVRAAVPRGAGATRSKDDSLTVFGGVLEVAGLETVYRDSAGVERQTFGGQEQGSDQPGVPAGPSSSRLSAPETGEGGPRKNRTRRPTITSISPGYISRTRKSTTPTGRHGEPWAAGPMGDASSFGYRPPLGGGLLQTLLPGRPPGMQRGGRKLLGLIVASVESSPSSHKKVDV